MQYVKDPYSQKKFSPGLTIGPWYKSYTSRFLLTRYMDLIFTAVATASHSTIEQGRIQVWANLPPPPLWQLNHANSAYFGTILVNFPSILTLGILFLQILRPALPLRVLWGYSAATVCAVASQLFVTVVSECPHSTLNSIAPWVAWLEKMLRFPRNMIKFPTYIAILPNISYVFLSFKLIGLYFPPDDKISWEIGSPLPYFFQPCWVATTVLHNMRPM